MRITIPYPEILPTKKAHDAFLFREAVELQRYGIEVDLLIGKGSRCPADLHHHYGTRSAVSTHALPILRKNNCLNLSWNIPFFYASQRWMRKRRPSHILLSVVKQAAYHLKRRLPTSMYLYEAHELAYYPNCEKKTYFALEKQMLEQVDLIIVTTTQLKHILCAPPYQITTPIEVIPLAVDAAPLPPPKVHLPPTVLYVGQLYKEQGIKELLEAMSHVPDVHLKIIGGTPSEITSLDPKLPNVCFTGFLPPSHMDRHAQDCHACIAPFLLEGRMPYVAHTKLHMYAAWGRQIIAPECEIVKESAPHAWRYRNQKELIKHLKRVRDAQPILPLLSPWERRIQMLATIL